MDRTDRLNSLAQDLRKYWIFDQVGNNTIMAEAADVENLVSGGLGGRDPTRVRLSLDEYEHFVATHTTTVRNAMQRAAKSGKVGDIGDRLERITDNVIASSAVTLAMVSASKLMASLDLKNLPGPPTSMAAFVCCPGAVPLAEVHIGAMRQLPEWAREPAVMVLCRGFAFLDGQVLGVYSIESNTRHGTPLLRVEYREGQWQSQFAALTAGLLLRMTNSTPRRRLRSSPVGSPTNTLLELTDQDVVSTVTCYAEHLAAQQPQVDAWIQTWLRHQELGSDASPENITPQPRHTAAIDLYLAVQKVLIEISQGQQGDEFHRQASARIRLATIYEVDASLFRQLLDQSKGLTDKLIEQYGGTLEQKLHKAAETAAPVPENRPFQDMFIALSRPIRLTQYPEVTAKLFGQIRQRPTHDVWCEALFITRDFPCLVFQAEPPHRELLSLWTDTWENPGTVLPWAIPWLIRLLDEHSDRVIEQRQSHVAYQTRAKKLRINAKTPPLYYAVTLRGHHLSVPPGGGGGSRNTEVEWRHRWYVQAHERAYIRRGPLPLQLSDRESLLRQDYQVFEGQVDGRCQEALSRRNKSPKRYDEWLAIKYVRVSETVKPDRPDLPLVPSTRRVKGLRMEETR